jgi:ribosomal protein S27AE
MIDITEVQKLKCPKCGKAEGWTSHTKVWHGGQRINNFRCKGCGTIKHEIQIAEFNQVSPIAAPATAVAELTPATIQSEAIPQSQPELYRYIQDGQKVVIGRPPVCEKCGQAMTAHDGTSPPPKGTAGFRVQRYQHKSPCYTRAIGQYTADDIKWAQEQVKKVKGGLDDIPKVD